MAAFEAHIRATERRWFPLKDDLIDRADIRLHAERKAGGRRGGGSNRLSARQWRNDAMSPFVNWKFRSVRARGVCYAVALGALVTSQSTFGALAEPTARSEYTSLDNKDCKMRWRATREDPESDSFESICPSRDGFCVILEGGDSRSWIGLLPHGAKYDDGVQFHSSGIFPSVEGRRLEWRYHGPKLVALIVRMWRQDETDPRNPKGIAELMVLRVDLSKLDQTCEIGRATSNEEARIIADDLDRTCK
jgi:hypothetical protein